MLQHLPHTPGINKNWHQPNFSVAKLQPFSVKNLCLKKDLCFNTLEPIVWSQHLPKKNGYKCIKYNNYTVIPIKTLNAFCTLLREKKHHPTTEPRTPAQRGPLETWRQVRRSRFGRHPEWLEPQAERRGFCRSRESHQKPRRFRDKDMAWFLGGGLIGEGFF